MRWQTQFWSISHKPVLNPAPPSPKNQINNYYRQHQAQTAAAVIANTRAHVVPSATGEDEQNNENDYQGHVITLA
jgi:hypothetical protein